MRVKLYVHLKKEFRSIAKGRHLCHCSLPLMNCFNTIEAAIFPMQAGLPEDFPFFSDRFVNFNP